MSQPLSPIHLRHAVSALHGGGVIAYATEAVWGLGCDPWCAEAVERIWSLKRRDPGKGLIVVAADWAQIQPWLQGLAAQDKALLQSSWPGPVTWVVPRPVGCPPWLHGRHDSLALRVSAHPGVRQLCRAFGGPLVSTSANFAGQPPARSLFAVRQRFGDALDYILPSHLGGLDRPTEIRDLLSRRVIRAG